MRPKKNSAFSYETAIKRLEAILTQVQEGKVPLDDLENVLKEARELVSQSRSYLRKLDGTIQELGQEETVE